MSDIDPKTLSGSKLEYFFLAACDVALFGVSEGPFALRSSEDNSLILFGADDSNTSHASYEDGFASLIFEVALKHAAKFSVTAGEAVCEIVQAGIIASGKSYAEAAMRALIALKQLTGKIT